MAADRHSEAQDAALLSDPDEIARREAENGLRQFTLALDIIRSYVKDSDRPFKLRAGPILQLHQAALDGLHRLAGTFRNTLEDADKAWASEKIDVSALEGLLSDMLAQQLLNAAKEAAGENVGPKPVASRA